MGSARVRTDRLASLAAKEIIGFAGVDLQVKDHFPCVKIWEMTPEFVSFGERYALTKTATCAPNEIGMTIGRLFGELFQEHQPDELLIPPCIYYHSWSEAGGTIEAALFVDPVRYDRSKLKIFPPCEALMLTHTGHYSGLPGVWKQMWDYIAGQNAQPNGVPWECYVSNHDETPDPNDLVTEVFVPID